MKSFLFVSFLLGTSFGFTINSDGFQAIVEKVNSLHTTWKANTELPPDLTISSFKRLLGVKKSERLLEFRVKHDSSDSAIPEEFDARRQWPHCPTIRHIRDQGNCGSCWAVAGAAAFSDRLCIATNGSFTEPLSTEELLTCCGACGDGCDGGFPESAWDYFAHHGLVTGGDYNSNVGCQPYSVKACEHHSTGDLPSCESLPEERTPKCHKKCTNEHYEGSFEKDHHKVESGYVLNDEKEIQKEIMKHGPVEASFSVYDDFPTYKSGVYQYTAGGYLGGHAVRMIGWGVENGTPYWLIANSWNTNWGDKGTFKILRGKNECNIESSIVVGIPIA